MAELARSSGPLDSTGRRAWPAPASAPANRPGSRSATEARPAPTGDTEARPAPTVDTEARPAPTVGWSATTGLAAGAAEGVVFSLLDVIGGTGGTSSDRRTTVGLTSMTDDDRPGSPCGGGPVDADAETEAPAASGGELVPAAEPGDAGEPLRPARVAAG